MRQNKSFIPTLKETPNDAAVPSHIFMLRAGLIRTLGAGIYSFMPLGYRIVKKVCEIIRQEMDAIGGQEFHLPALNPIEIWEETNRVEAFGDNLFHIKNRDYVLAPTHEEIMTYHARKALNSYKDLPQIWYQIQTKFRNEPRPRSGVLRGRQFLMKDAYSFDTSKKNLDKSYALHDGAYRKIFSRCGVEFFVVGASSGAMGGSGSEEFMVQSNAGEDTVAHCKACGYAANVEIANSIVSSAANHEEVKEVYDISTPNVKSIDELCAFLNINESECAKSRIYIVEDKPVFILMSGNDEVNETKLEKVLGSAFRPAHPDELKAISGADAGSIGPVGYKGKILADLRLKGGNLLYSGANKNDYHVGGIDLSRDVPTAEYVDLRTARSGEGCPRCKKELGVFTSIELGHIFKLGTKYSEAMGALFSDEGGKEHPLVMGSYGIGVERVIACYIEQHHDENGIIWNRALAPFDIHLIGLNLKKEAMSAASEKLYSELSAKYEVLFDDRVEASAGFKFKDADLLGMPIQVIVAEKKLAENKVEVKIRKTGERFDVEIEKLSEKIEEIFNSLG